MWIDVFRIITIAKSYFYLIGVKSTFNFGFPFASKKSTIACLMSGGSRSPALKKKRKNFDEILPVIGNNAIYSNSKVFGKGTTY